MTTSCHTTVGFYELACACFIIGENGVMGRPILGCLGKRRKQCCSVKIKILGTVSLLFPQVSITFCLISCDLFPPSCWCTGKPVTSTTVGRSMAWRRSTASESPYRIFPYIYWFCSGHPLNVPAVLSSVCKKKKKEKKSKMNLLSLHWQNLVYFFSGRTKDRAK